MKQFLILLSVLCPTLVFGQAMSWRALDFSQMYSNAFVMGIRDGYVTTNGTFYRTNTFVGPLLSPGTDPSGFKAGNNAVSVGSGLAIGQNASASNTAIAIGYLSSASAPVSFAFGDFALASGNASLALGYFATVTHTNSSAIGPLSVTTADNQVMIGRTNQDAFFPGTATFNGGMTINGGLTADSFSIATNLYGSVTAVNFQNQISTTNLSGNLTFDLGLVNFNPTNENSLILKCFGDGANRTVAAPASWYTSRAAHVVTNGQWSWILVSAQIGVVTNMSQIDFPN